VRYTVQGIIIRYNGECISTQRTINVLREFDPSREPGDSSANSVNYLTPYSIVTRVPHSYNEEGKRLIVLSDYRNLSIKILVDLKSL
jgi:hypothetical protein